MGLDIAKRKHHGFFGDANGRTLLKGLIVENSAGGFRHLLTQVRFYIDREGLSRVVFGLEPTSVYHKPLAEHLIEQGHLVVYPPSELHQLIQNAAIPLRHSSPTCRNLEYAFFAYYHRP